MFCKLNEASNGLGHARVEVYAFLRSFNTPEPQVKLPMTYSGREGLLGVPSCKFCMTMRSSPIRLFHLCIICAFSA